MSKPLGIALAVVFSITILYYGAGLFGSGVDSPDDLVAIALSDADLAVRERAALDLVKVGPSARPDLRRVLTESKDSSVQAAAIDGMSALKDWEGVPALLDAMETSDSPLVRSRASRAVGRMLGAEYPYNARTDPKTQAAVLATMRAEYDRMLKNPPPEYRN